MSKPKTTLDPMEAAFEDTCRRYGVLFERDDIRSGLDFYLPAFDCYVEVKQFHSDRIAEQMSRKENVIAIQGKAAMTALDKMLNKAFLAGVQNVRAN